MPRPSVSPAKGRRGRSRRAGAAGDFLKENLDVAAQFASYVTPGDVSSVEEIRPGSGAIVRDGLRKLAVYRDEAGVLIHQYGPHIFHTNSERIFAYLSQFTAWRPYQHKVLARVEGKLLPIPNPFDDQWLVDNGYSPFVLGAYSDTGDIDSAPLMGDATQRTGPTRFGGDVSSVSVPVTFTVDPSTTRVELLSGIQCVSYTVTSISRVEARQTSACVRKPAGRPRWLRSSPIRLPAPSAATRRKRISKYSWSMPPSLGENDRIGTDSNGWRYKS